MKRIAVAWDAELFIQNGIYGYRGTPIGMDRRVERSLGLREGVATQREVRLAKKALLDRLEIVGSATGRTADIMDRYVEFRREERDNPDVANALAPRTFKETEGLINKYLKPFYFRFKLEDFDQPNFDDYCRKYKTLNLTNHLKVLNHFLSWCVSRKYLKSKYELEIPKFARKARRERIPLTDTEIKALITHAQSDKILLYVCMYALMGMRNMEICSIMWSEIDLEKGTLWVNPRNNRKRRARSIPINPFVLDLLKARFEAQKYQNMGKTKGLVYVFPTSKIKSACPHWHPGGGVYKSWNNLVEMAGIQRPITPHDLRATFETHLSVNKDFTVDQREKMAGAKIDVQKDIYIKLQAEQLRGLEKAVKVDGLDEILKGKTGGKRGGKTVQKSRY